jgi:hypothetical protein
MPQVMEAHILKSRHIADMEPELVDSNKGPAFAFTRDYIWIALPARQPGKNF